MPTSMNTISGQFFYYLECDFSSLNESIDVYFINPPNTHTQIFQSENINPQPKNTFEFMTEKTKHKLLQWSFTPQNIGRNSYWITYDFKIENRFNEASIHKELEGIKAKLINYPFSELKEFIEKIQQDFTCDTDKILAVFYILSSRFNYGESNTFDGDLKSFLGSKTGDCECFHQLSTHIFKQLNIKSRKITGLWLESGGGHIFTEVYTKKLGWIYFDPSLESFYSKNRPDSHSTFYFGHSLSSFIITTVGENHEFNNIIYEALQPGALRARPPAMSYSKGSSIVFQGSVFTKNLQETKTSIKKEIENRWDNWKHFFSEQLKEVQTKLGVTLDHK